MQVNMYQQVDEETIKTLEERYKCHFTIKEVASEFGFSYGQINSLFYKFKLKGIDKYDRTRLSKGETYDAHSISA